MRNLIENICLGGVIASVVGFIISVQTCNNTIFIFSAILLLLFLTIILIDISRE